MSQTRQPPAAWMVTAGNGVKVVVLDSALTPTPYLSPVAVRRFIDGPTDSQHASKVVQIIAGQEPGRLGLAPACCLYVGEVVGNQTRGWRGLCEALDWALALGADVVNMSFACAVSEQRAEDKLAALDAAGCICIASYNAYLHWPHSVPSVVAVGLPGQAGTVDLRANDEVPVMVRNQQEFFRGTSAAAARIAGIAACAKATTPALNRGCFVKQLLGQSRVMAAR